MLGICGRVDAGRVYSGAGGFLYDGDARNNDWVLGAYRAGRERTVIVSILNEGLRIQLQDLAVKWVDAVANMDKKRVASEEAAIALNGAHNLKAEIEKHIRERTEIALKRTARIVVLAPNAKTGAIVIESGRVSTVDEDGIVGLTGGVESALLEVARNTKVEVVGPTQKPVESANDNAPEGEE